MSRRKKPTPQSLNIWEQLERISQAYYAAQRRHEDPAEARAAWQKLWQETVAGDKLSTVDVDDAGRILSWGWTLAMAAGNYPVATDVLSPYLVHPRIENADLISKIHLRCNLASGILHSGYEERAVEIYRPLLESEDNRTAQIARSVIRAQVHGFCSKRGSNGCASVALRDLVEELVNRLKRRVPLKKRLPENATYAELLQLLDSTYPPRVRRPCGQNGKAEVDTVGIFGRARPSGDCRSAEAFRMSEDGAWPTDMRNSSALRQSCEH